jgi:hypothetical protein
VEKVIYRARPGHDLEQALKVLSDAGHSPVLLDDPKPDVFTWIATMGTMRIRIAVPEEEFDAAARTLSDWEAETAPRAELLAKQFERQAIVTLLLVAVVVALLLFFL